MKEKKENELLKKIAETEIPVELKQELLKNLTENQNTDSYEEQKEKYKNEGYIIAVKNRYDKESSVYNYKNDQWFSFTTIRKKLPEKFVEKWRKENDNELYMLSMRPDMPIGEFVNESGIKCWNTFTGWNTEPQKKDFPNIKDYLYRIICNSDDANYQYLLKWLSKIISNPKSKSEVALALMGIQGTGKNTMYYILNKIMGSKYCYTTSEKEDITGKFNGWLNDNILIFFDEAGLQKPEYNKIKQWISQDEVSIQYKCKDSSIEKNFSNFMLATNDIKFLPLENTERRWFVLEVNNEGYGKKEYWKSLYENHIPNEIEGFMNYLMELNVERLEEPPLTEAKKDQQEMNISPVVEWWYEYIKREDFNTFIEKSGSDNVLKCSIALNHFTSSTIYDRIHIRRFINEIRINANVKLKTIHNAQYFIVSSIYNNDNGSMGGYGSINKSVENKLLNNNDKEYMPHKEMNNFTLPYPPNPPIIPPLDDNFEDQFYNMLKSPNADLTYCENEIQMNEVI
jgi:hypothetical protein